MTDQPSTQSDSPRWKPGDRVAVHVPAVEGIGDEFYVLGFVRTANPGHLVVIDCDDGQVRWRRPDTVLPTMPAESWDLDA
jgi:hypothetical protein